MIQSLLIANRGEIACRIIRTARRLGIATVAVYSDADARALHVRQADQAVHIGPSSARESYLAGDKIIAAAQAAGAQAIHPGYGFLSENADFAQAVIDAGLVWVGPDPASIRAMGLKDEAKRRMVQAGVPVTPGYMGEDQSPDRLASEAAAIGYPVLIKAVAGGGGKGMRKVDAPADFADALASCRREATSSFGNSDVLLEKWVTNPRHIEVQIFGDTHGNIVHLFERDCSLQRRHQKVIEEAPAPGMDAATREAICDAAVRAARAVNYVGAGTIEFIADAGEGLRADRIWFMEMNTRLQVEHPVTEEITGVDLVEWQLRVASGEPLPKRQDELSISGWAIEARLYAEDTERGFLPSPGRIDRLSLGYVPAPRCDFAVEQGDTVPMEYDPMIGKLIAHGRDRQGACDRLVQTASDMLIWPIRTNMPLLCNLLVAMRDDRLVADTGLIDRDLALFLPSAVPSPGALGFALNEFIEIRFRPGEGGSHEQLCGFRLNAARRERGILWVDGVATDAAYLPGDDEEGIGTSYWVDDDQALLVENGKVFAIGLRAPETASLTISSGAIASPMPGRIIAVSVVAGDRVTKGQRMITLEAMKMEHSLVAPHDGTVAELAAILGGQVLEGALLARVDAEPVD